MSDVEKDISELKSRVTKLEAQIKALESKAAGGDPSSRRPAAPVKFERNTRRL
jgi:cell division septum initiation protein DivIVA